MAGNEVEKAAEQLGVSADELAGFVAARRALGPDSEDAVIAGFLEKTGKAIDARVEARLAEQVKVKQENDKNDYQWAPFILACVSLGLGIPITGVAATAGLLAVVVVWIAIAAINVAFTISHRKSSSP